MPDEPFDALGLRGDATADEVRAARRQLAKRHHPDRGGDPAVMRSLNDAAAAALRRIAHAGRSVVEPEAPGPPSAGRSTPGASGEEPSGMMSDMPSFTVEALPVETFEALLIVADRSGDVLDDDPPYRLDVMLGAPLGCWCRLDLVPDAGATTVSITIGALDGDALPGIDAVRDMWVDRLNQL